MNQPDPSARPSQVTVAGWGIAVASVLLVFAVFDTIGQLQTVDMRDRVAEAIRSGSAKGFGFTVDDILGVMRWCLYVSGVAGAVTGVLGIFVLQGHRGARVVASIAAVSIVLTASIAGSFTAFLGMFIAVGTALLWSRPARDWFDGRPVAPPVRPAPPVERRPEPPTTPLSWAPPTAGTAQPPPTPGWGEAPPAPGSPVDLAWPAPTPPPGDQETSALAPSEPTAPPAPAPIPRQVRLACILTGVFSSLTALGYAAVAILLAVDQDRMVTELKKSPAWQKSFDVDTVTTVVTVASSVFVVWSVAAVVLAVLVSRRVRWAWIVLLVSAWAAGLVSVLAFPLSLPYLAAIGATTGILMRRPTREWFAGASPSGPREQPPATRPPLW